MPDEVARDVEKEPRALGLGQDDPQRLQRSRAS
jgi:hypothetical protein